MPKKEWKIYLNHHRYIFVQRDTDSNRFAVVLVEEETNRNIARFDNAHGYPHLDILATDGTLINKIKLIKLTRDKAITYAIHHFKNNSEKYL